MFSVSSVPASELVDQVLDADAAEDDDRIDGLLCGGLKTLKSTRAKPASQLYLSLMYLAKIKPMLFESEDVVDVRKILDIIIITPTGMTSILSVL